MKINNLQVYGLNNAIRCSKFPMAIDTNQINESVTQTVINLGNSDIGHGHDQFITGIITQFDLTFSIKAWVEAERYHFFDFISSQSTMHRIAKFDIKSQCNEYVTENTINEANRLKNIYLNTQDKEDYLTLLYNVPTGFQLTAGMTTNYRQLKTIYTQRKQHRLPEWRHFCEWIETLPHFKELCLGGEQC
ncbi:MAG: hypothetical protein K0S18_18 [Anaerocolumna sp.]|jgi:hypothetical protein|nr:hypothetical protein [Anaerocolumna sp.]